MPERLWASAFPPGVPPEDYETQGHAYVLIPCDENHPDVEGCDYRMVEAAAAAQSAVRQYVPTGTQRLHQLGLHQSVSHNRPAITGKDSLKTD